MSCGQQGCTGGLQLNPYPRISSFTHFLYMQLAATLNIYIKIFEASTAIERLGRASLPRAFQTSRNLEEVRQSGHEPLGDQFVNGLSRVVVVVPHSRRSIRIRGCDVAVKAERGGVVEDLPEVGAGIEGLSSNTGVAGLEGVELGGELGVERVQVGGQSLQGVLGLVVECRSLVEGCSKVVISQKSFTVGTL